MFGLEGHTCDGQHLPNQKTQRTWSWSCCNFAAPSSGLEDQATSVETTGPSCPDNDSRPTIHLWLWLLEEIGLIGSDLNQVTSDNVPSALVVESAERILQMFNILTCFVRWITSNKFLTMCEAFVPHFCLRCTHYIVPESLLNHSNSFHGGMFKLNTKFDAGSLLYSVILNEKATEYPWSLKGIYHPHWLVQWSRHCLCMHMPVHSPWLPGYTDVAQTVLIILTVAGFFLDGPRMLSSSHNIGPCPHFGRCQWFRSMFEAGGQGLNPFLIQLKIIKAFLFKSYFPSDKSNLCFWYKIKKKYMEK